MQASAMNIRDMLDMFPKTVQTRKGWMGQIAMGGEILWESEPQSSQDEALQAVFKHILAAFKSLFLIVPALMSDSPAILTP